MAVGAPGPGDDRENHLPLEPRVEVGDDFAIGVREAVSEHFVGVPDGGVRLIVGWLGQALRASRFRPVSHQRTGPRRRIQIDRERSIGLRRNLQQSGSRAVEVAGHKRAVLPGAGECASVAIHSQNRRGDVGSVLLDNETPCLFPLRRLVRNLPDTVDGRHIRQRGRRRCHITFGMKRAAAAAGALGAGWTGSGRTDSSDAAREYHLAIQFPIPHGGLYGRQIMLEVQLHLAFVNAGAGCGLRVRSVVERTDDIGSVVRNIEPERDGRTTLHNRRGPRSVQVLGSSGLG